MQVLVFLSDFSGFSIFTDGRVSVKAIALNLIASLIFAVATFVAHTSRLSRQAHRQRQRNRKGEAGRAEGFAKSRNPESRPRRAQAKVR